MRLGRLLAGVLFAAVSFGLAPARAADPVELKFSDFYVDDGSVVFSERLKALAGKPILVRGFIAPPLKPTLDFVVLTRDQVDLCPYCATDADWPRDTLVVYMRVPSFKLDARFKVAGTLEIGAKMDPETGFVSQLRLMNARIVD